VPKHIKSCKSKLRITALAKKALKDLEKAERAPLKDLSKLVCAAEECLKQIAGDPHHVK
jgi:hypothetical protein